MPKTKTAKKTKRAKNGTFAGSYPIPVTPVTPPEAQPSARSAAPDAVTAPSSNINLLYDAYAAADADACECPRRLRLLPRREFPCRRIGQAAHDRPDLEPRRDPLAGRHHPDASRVHRSTAHRPDPRRHRGHRPRGETACFPVPLTRGAPPTARPTIKRDLHRIDMRG